MIKCREQSMTWPSSGLKWVLMYVWQHILNIKPRTVELTFAFLWYWWTFDMRCTDLHWICSSTVQAWPLRDWWRVWFTRFLLQRWHGRQRVYRRRKKPFAPKCVWLVKTFCCGSVMMWGTISYTWWWFRGIWQQIGISVHRLSSSMVPSSEYLQRELFQHDTVTDHDFHHNSASQISGSEPGRASVDRTRKTCTSTSTYTTDT